MRKRGATVMQYVLILGMIIVGLIALSSIQSLFFWEAKNKGYDQSQMVFDRFKDEISVVMSFPSDRISRIDLDSFFHYRLSMMNNELIMEFPSLEINISEVIVAGNINLIPFELSDSGKVYAILKGRNFLYTDSIPQDGSVFDEEDDVCDPSSIYFGLCDPDCYQEGMHDSCISYCVDQNMDMITDASDSDGICDPDCYNRFRNGGIYDFDCLISNDDICDPDTHMVQDNYCDTDCLGQNGVCDPDCGRYDVDCPHNGNDICEIERGEDCMDVDCDCPYNKVCLSNCRSLIEEGLVDEIGCVYEDDLKKGGETCLSSCECVRGLTCYAEKCGLV